MAFSLPLPRRLARQWAVKIRDQERVEPPHVTILRRGQAWRLNLQTGQFIDKEPDPDEVPRAVRRVIDDNWQHLQNTWDTMYPENPVQSEDDRDE